MQLARARLNLKGTGIPLCAVLDVNGDGLPCLIVPVCGQALQPSPAARPKAAETAAETSSAQFRERPRPAPRRQPHRRVG